MRHLVVLFAMAVLLLPAWASNLGEPLDCSDWTLNQPGFTCVEQQSDCTGLPCTRGATLIEVTNAGQLLGLRSDVGGGCGPVVLFRWELFTTDGLNEDIVGWVVERCADPVTGTKDAFEPILEQNPNPKLAVIHFDAVGGRLLLPATSRCRMGALGTSCGVDQYNVSWLLEIKGFAPLLDVFQSYEPMSSQLSFRVPAMPESFQAADSFDTYYGQLGNYDFSQAQSLQCDYPTAIPAVGDYLTVADTLPTPAPGTGRWYLTAVNYQGETRYGRKNIGGALSGRDPSVLPGCQ